MTADHGLPAGLVTRPGTSAVYQTAGWRTEIPRFLLAACNGCDRCVAFCPEGIVVRLGKNRYGFDHDYCKGCGICAKECPVDDIVMEVEVR
ncbi:MAG TPA: 4Fe-4S binding protein [Actinomycetota bacterium]|nr:4Fe-4S binding protein [Actinomycetota bacterium]